jgi:hypothetical protein
MTDLQQIGIQAQKTHKENHAIHVTHNLHKIHKNLQKHKLVFWNFKSPHTNISNRVHIRIGSKLTYPDLHAITRI